MTVNINEINNRIMITTTTVVTDTNATAIRALAGIASSNLLDRYTIEITIGAEFHAESVKQSVLHYLSSVNIE